MNHYDIQREPHSISLYQEIFPLLEAYHKEVAGPSEPNWNPCVDTYMALGSGGHLGVYTVRFNSELVGFMTLVSSPNHHDKDFLLVKHDTLYIKPEHRSLSLFGELLRKIETDLQTLGAPGLTLTSSMKRPLGPLFSRYGYEKTEQVYFKGF